MPGGRGELLEYCKEAADKARKLLKQCYESSPPVVQAAVAKGAFDDYAASIIPTAYLTSQYTEDATEVSMVIYSEYFSNYSSDLVEAAVIAGVLAISNADLNKSYVLVKDGY